MEKLVIGDYFKINIQREQEVIYKAVILSENFVTAQVVYPRQLAINLASEGSFMIDIASLCIEVIGNGSQNKLLDAIYG